MTYDRTVSAALAETKSKFGLAEALALDIPPRRSGPSEDATISEYLTEARQAIIDNGGEPHSVGTFAHYRKTALWVQDGDVPNFHWVRGTSFTAHNEARLAGLSYEEFVASPVKTTDAFRKTAGKAGTDGPAEKIAASWSEDEKVAAARELLSDPDVSSQIPVEPDVVRNAVTADPQARRAAREALDDHYDDAPKPYDKPEPQDAKPLELVTVFRDMHKLIDRAARLVADGRAVVSEAEREALVAEVTWLRTALDHIESGLNAGSLDQALADLLESDR